MPVPEPDILRQRVGARFSGEPDEEIRRFLPLWTPGMRCLKWPRGVKSFAGFFHD
jgi:hypothetical protein